MADKFNKRIAINYFDPDQVELKNCYRQNFCEAEIGRNKADALAYRYGLAWGMEITAVGEPFDGRMERCDLVLLIGCVDNPAARKSILANLSRGAWWLDCGNAGSYGQVLLGRGDEVKKPFELPGFCSWLPLPSTQHPELIEAAPADDFRQDTELSCADLAMLDSQGMAINQRMAAEATDYLVRMLLTRDLQKMATYIDLASGTAKSVYITPENVGARTKETEHA